MSHQCKTLTSCSICLEEIDPSKGSATMMCGHQFHYNCIFKWNLTQKGDTCPLCREDLQLPDDLNESIEDEDTREIINIASTPGQISINNQKTMLTKFLDLSERQELGFNVGCNTCKRTLHKCDFCSRPFCACRNTNGLAHFPANPFNKFYNTLFNHDERDDEMISTVGITHPFGEDLLSPRVCGCCFNNRDIVLSQTMSALCPSGYTESVFDKSEIKILYYSLFYDNSGVDNTSLQTVMPSYKTYQKFKDYIMFKYGIPPRVPKPKPRPKTFKSSRTAAISNDYVAPPPPPGFGFNEEID